MPRTLGTLLTDAVSVRLGSGHRVVERGSLRPDETPAAKLDFPFGEEPFSEATG